MNLSGKSLCKSIFSWFFLIAYSMYLIVGGLLAAYSKVILEHELSFLVFLSKFSNSLSKNGLTLK